MRSNAAKSRKRITALRQVSATCADRAHYWRAMGDGRAARQWGALARAYGDDARDEAFGLKMS